MRDLLSPIFSILTGLSFMGILVIGLFARSAIRPLWAKLMAFSVVCAAVGFMLFSRATAATSLGAGGELFLAGGAAFFLGVILVVSGMFIRSRETT